VPSAIPKLAVEPLVSGCASPVSDGYAFVGGVVNSDPFVAFIESSGVLVESINNNLGGGIVYRGYPNCC